MPSLRDLRERIWALPEPYQTRARANYCDAIDDLTTWPRRCKRIVEDLEEAVISHEQDAREPFVAKDV